MKMQMQMQKALDCTFVLTIDLFSHRCAVHSVDAAPSPFQTKDAVSLPRCALSRASVYDSRQRSMAHVSKEHDLK
jgi:hypothetical protein